MTVHDQTGHRERRPASRRSLNRLPPSLLAAGLVACAAVLPACSDGGGQVSPPVVTAPVALPAGAAVVDPAGVPEPTADDCDARASLAPPQERPAPGNMPEGTTLAKIAKRGYLRAGVDQSSYLAGYRDPLTGEFVGFDIDLLREIAVGIFGDDEPDRLRFTVLAAAQRQRALADGRVDIVASTMTITCQRREPERYFDDDYVERFPAVEFSSPYFVSEQRVMVRRDSSITGPDDLGGARVCAPAGTTVAQNIAHYELPASSDPMDLVTVEVRSDCLSLLQLGQVDAVTTSETTLSGFAGQDPNLQTVGTGLDDLPYGLAMSPDEPELTRFVNHILADLASSGRWLEIFDDWVGPSGPLASGGLTGLGPPTAHYRDSPPDQLDTSQ